MTTNNQYTMSCYNGLIPPMKGDLINLSLCKPRTGIDHLPRGHIRRTNYYRTTVVDILSALQIIAGN